MEVVAMANNITTKERLSKEFDEIMQTIINDKDRIIETMLDRCMYANISIPFERGEVPHYEITFAHVADIIYD
jgi:hypothetical protein